MDPNCRAVQGVGLRLLACWDSRFESHSDHGHLYLFSVGFRHEEAPDPAWSPVQRFSTKCGVLERDREASIMRMP